MIEETGMRYAPGHKEETRQRILDAAGKVFRKQGFSKASVEDVMGEAGLTVGGFYSHFDSKDELFTEMLSRVIRSAAERLNVNLDLAPPEERARTFANSYLSSAHRKMVADGCPIPPLLSEMTRAKGAPRKAFEKIIRQASRRLASLKSEGEDPEAFSRALALLSLCVGGLALSRCVSDDKLAEQILAACRELAAGALDAPEH